MTYVCMKQHITIVKAEPEDAETLAQIKQRVWLTTYQNKDLSITEEEILSKDFLCPQRIAKRAEHMGKVDGINHTLVARNGTEVAGYGRAVKGENYNEIVTLYVLPEWQGQGIGTMLIKELLTWLDDGKDISLGVVPYNAQAIRFYKKFGFKLGNIIPHSSPVFPSGKDLPEVEMLHIASPHS